MFCLATTARDDQTEAAAREPVAARNFRRETGMGRSLVGVDGSGSIQFTMNCRMRRQDGTGGNEGNEDCGCRGFEQEVTEGTKEDRKPRITRITRMNEIFVGALCARSARQVVAVGTARPTILV